MDEHDNHGTAHAHTHGEGASRPHTHEKNGEVTRTPIKTQKPY
jgi:hypothetical protein